MKFKDIKQKIKEKWQRMSNRLIDEDNINTTYLYIIFGCFVVLVLWGIVFKCNFNNLIAIEEKRLKPFEERFTMQLIPIEAIKAFLANGTLVGVLAYLLNFVALVPFGFLLGFITSEKRGLLFTFFFILAIEVFQFFSYFGVFDFADIILNMLGTFLGIRLSRWAKKRFSAKTINTVSLFAIIPLIAVSIFAIVRTIIYFPV